MRQDQYTLEDIYDVAGTNLTEKMLAVVGDDALLSWFYKPNEFFHQKSPYEVIKEDPSKLEKAIMDVLTAAQGA